LSLLQVIAVRFRLSALIIKFNEYDLNHNVNGKVPLNPQKTMGSSTLASEWRLDVEGGQVVSHSRRWDGGAGDNQPLM